MSIGRFVVFDTWGEIYMESKLLLFSPEKKAQNIQYSKSANWDNIQSKFITRKPFVSIRRDILRTTTWAELTEKRNTSINQLNNVHAMIKAD